MRAEPNDGSVDESLAALGEPGRRPSDWLSGDRAAKLIAHVYDPCRQHVASDGIAIRRLLHKRWGVSCVEVDADVHEAGPLKTPIRQLGRANMRILAPLGEAQPYIALARRADASESRLALLHELGHLAHHADVLQSVGTLYLRICCDPLLELDIGRLMGDGFRRELRELLEREADLFALTWLVPLWVDDPDAQPACRDIPDSLTVDGRRFWLLRSLFTHCASDTTMPGNVPALNARGDETRSWESSRDYPADDTLAARMSWVLFNRPSIISTITNERRRLLQAYFRVAGPPRHMPELTRTRVRSRQPDPRLVWIRRLAPLEIEQAVDDAHWEPVMVESSGKSSSDYHIPVTPVPAVVSQDSQVEWRHMMKPAHAVTRRLSDWVGRAVSQRANLLVFPRNPAERQLDQNRALR